MLSNCYRYLYVEMRWQCSAGGDWGVFCALHQYSMHLLRRMLYCVLKLMFVRALQADALDNVTPTPLSPSRQAETLDR